MKQCRDIDELMVDYLYQELDGAEGEAFREHVESCARCSAELKGLQQMRQALHSLPEVEPSAAVTSRLLHEAGKRARAEESGGLLSWFAKLLTPVMAHPAWTAAGTVLLIAGVAGVMSMRGKVSERTQAVDVASGPAAAETRTVAAAPASPPPAAATPPTETAKPEPEKKAFSDGDEAHANRRDVRAPDRPEPPRDYVNKVAAPAVAAKMKTKPRDDLGANDLKEEAPQGYRGARISSDQENALIKDEAKAGKAELDRRAEQAEQKPPPEPKADDSTGEDRAKSSGESYGQTADKPADVKPNGPAALAKPAPRQPVTATPSMPQGAAGGAPPASRREEPPGQAYSTTTPAAPAAEPAPSPPPPPPAKPVAQAPKEAERQTKAISQVQEKGRTGADSAGAAAPVTESTQQAQNRKQPPSEPPEVTLLKEAQRSASLGNCGDALAISRRILRMNSEFHRKRVAGDASLRACQLESQKKAPARKAAPADALEAAPDASTQKESAK